MTTAAPPPPPPDRAPVEAYLAELAARLPGPARARAGIVAELRSGLLDAADAHRSAGLPADRAARAAIREFGEPGPVADGFRAELAACQARLVSVRLVIGGPLVGMLWLAAALASRLGLRLAPPWRGPDLSPALGLGARLVIIVIVTSACAALAAVAATGRLTRWLPARPRRAPTAAVIAGLGAAGTDVVMLALLAGQLAIAPGTLAPLPVAAAAAASLIRLSLAARGAHQCLVIRAALA
jgi:hypothetical protein